jgi:hypothetical protein
MKSLMIQENFPSESCAKSLEGIWLAVSFF